MTKTGEPSLELAKNKPVGIWIRVSTEDHAKGESTEPTARAQPEKHLLKRLLSALFEGSAHPAPIQTTVLDRLAHVLGLDVGRSVQVGDGPGDLEHAMIAARR